LLTLVRRWTRFRPTRLSINRDIVGSDNPRIPAAEENQESLARSRNAKARNCARDNPRVRRCRMRQWMNHITIGTVSNTSRAHCSGVGVIEV
jgi:hypothetical protein